jgi:hypothetical protein
MSTPVITTARPRFRFTGRGERAANGVETVGGVALTGKRIASVGFPAAALPGL